jgi:hypothetical protein
MRQAARLAARRLSTPRKVVDARATTKTNVPLLATGVVAGAWLTCLELPVQLGDNCPASVRDAWWLKLYREATGRALTRTATPVTAIAEPQVEEDDLAQIAEPDLDDDDDEVLDPSLERERLDALEDAKKKAEAEAQRELDEEAARVVGRASEIVAAVQSVPEEAADDLVTRLARDLQGLNVDELSQRLTAAEAASTKEASREAARAATARDEASRVYAKRTEDLVKAQRLKLLEEMGSLVQADAVDSDRMAEQRRRALRAEKDSVLETQRKEIDARWAADGRRAVEDAVGAVESGARALVDAARADAAQATGDAAVSRLMSLRELEVRVAAAHRAADAVPPDSDARILSEHAVVARGAAGSRAVGAVADDAVVAVALKARAEAPGVSTDVAALRARWVERVRPAARAAVRGPASLFLPWPWPRRTPADAVDESESGSDAVDAAKRHPVARRRWSRSTPGPSRARRSGASSRRCACPGAARRRAARSRRWRPATRRSSTATSSARSPRSRRPRATSRSRSATGAATPRRRASPRRRTASSRRGRGWSRRSAWSE